MNIRVIFTFGIFVCLISPKFDIINIEGFAQGIRYDDLFLLLCLLWLIIRNNFTLNIFPNKSLYFFFYIYILYFGLLSYYNTNIYSILLPLRWIEYSIFYLIISKINLSLRDIRKIIIAYIVINAIFVILQYYQIVGGIYSHGYFPNVVDRISGLTGGSWELPALLAMFVSTLILDDYYKKKYITLILIVILSSIMVYLTGTRTGMAVYIAGIVFATISKLQINIFSITAICIPVFLFLNQDRVSPYVESGTLPPSMDIRFNAWNFYFDQMDYYAFMYGKGLGFSGLHVDGMFAKIFIDMGILGLLIFSLYFIKLLYPYKVIGLIILLYCISIDFFTASKLMFGMYLSIYYLSQQKIHTNAMRIAYLNKYSTYQMQV